MKTAFISITCMALLTGSGCVSRTVYEGPEYRGARNKQELGSDPATRKMHQKLVWFWQDEFRQGK